MTENWPASTTLSQPATATGALTGFGRAVLQLLEFVASICAVAIGAVLAVVVAAFLLLVGLVGGALMAFAGLAWGARRRVAYARAAAPGRQLIEARRVGHSWVAYGWDRR